MHHGGVKATRSGLEPGAVLGEVAFTFPADDDAQMTMRYRTKLFKSIMDCGCTMGLGEFAEEAQFEDVEQWLKEPDFWVGTTAPPALRMRRFIKCGQLRGRIAVPHTASRCRPSAHKLF